MKILILGTSRSGTTSLTRGIQSQGYDTIEEPFNELVTGNRNYPLPELSEDKNICVKTLCDQVPKNLNTTFIDFAKEFIEHFHRVILLDRKNDLEHEESFVHLMWRISRNEKVLMEWTGDIIPQDFKDEFYYHNHHNHLYLQKEQLKEISKDIDIPITWYEDLYGQDRMESFNIINKWDIDDIDPFELNEYLHPKNKLKKSDKKSMI